MEQDLNYLIRKKNTKLPVPAMLPYHAADGGTGELPVLTFPEVEDTGAAKLIFTTRLGGVSGMTPGTEHLSSLNLSFSRGDDLACVRENFRRVADALGTVPDRFVFTDQTHTDHVRVVTEADAGCGLTRERTYHDIDALVTNTPGLVLSVFIADCVPVAMVDPVHRAIGLAHSGWRGTVSEISGKTIEKMTACYGTDPADLVCAIGPSICRDCYEVSEDVAVKFQEEFPLHISEIMDAKGGGKYQLDLWAANRVVLEEAGVRSENIEVTDICTMCNPDRLFSHRATHGKRGNNGGFIMLKK